MDMSMFKIHRTPSQVAQKLTLCSKPSTNLACFPEETALTEVDRSEPADSVPGPRRPTARGRSSGSSHGSTCPEESRGGERGARGDGPELL